MLNPENKATAAPSPPLKNGRPKTSRKTDFPSYIPSRTFVTALLGFDQKVVAVSKDADVREALRRVDQSIKEIPSERVQKAMTALLHGAQGDAVAFRHAAEQWFDDHMERVSGWYRRRIQKVLWVLAIVVALTLNADALQIGKRLWVDPSVRAAVVNQAQNASGKTNPSTEIKALPVPLGWHLASARHDPQGFPFYERWSMLWALLSKLIGLSVTAVAITFGAPFWFDALSKIARLRSSGAPPVAADATRRGEGEETRRGDRAAPPTTFRESVDPHDETAAVETPAKPQPQRSRKPRQQKAEGRKPVADTGEQEAEEQ
jgi:hypothetical protein